MLLVFIEPETFFMAKLDTPQMLDLLSPMLPAGDTLLHSAYGTRQPNMLLMLPAFALAIIPGVILTHVLTKHYIVGLSQTALLIAEVSPKWRSMMVAVDAVKPSRVIPLAELRGQTAKVKTSTLFRHIDVGQGDERFKAKFHRAFSKSNRPEANAIGDAIVAATGA